jgi:hypothetical protein
MRTPRELLAHLMATGAWTREGISFPADLDVAALRNEIREVLSRDPERPERQVLSEEEEAVGRAVTPLVQAARRRKVG